MPDNRQRSHCRRKYDFVGVCAELDIRSEERLELRRCRLAIVSDPQLARCQAAVRDLPADAHHRHQPELDLMSVRVPMDVDVFESNRCRAIILAEMQADALVHDPAISLGVAAAQVKSKEFVPKFFGYEI